MDINIIMNEKTAIVVAVVITFIRLAIIIRAVIKADKAYNEDNMKGLIVSLFTVLLFARW